MANDNLGASFSIDVTNLKAGLAQANRLIRESESEFKAAAAGMDDWSASQEGLEAQAKNLNNVTDLQKKKVAALQQEYDRLVADGLDPASAQATDLRTKINNETAALNKNEKALADTKQKLEEFEDGAEGAADAAEDMADAADDAGNGLDGLKGIAGGVVGAIAAIGAACVAAVGAFLGLAESTRESRENMAKLETAFSSAGLSAEAAESTFTDLYGILGDEGRATEAAQQIAKISNNEDDLAANTRILTGVMAEYGDSIPTEGLAEGMAATAAMGEVQGVLADALEWQGVNLDDYNAELAKLTTEEERAAYIQQTLTDLYGESADAYAEANAEIIASREAQAGLNQALNDLGAIAEPIMTTLKTLATELLREIMPFVELIGNGLQGALAGSAGSADMLAQGISGILSTLLGQLGSMLPTVASTLLSVLSTIIPSAILTISQQLPLVISTILSFLPQLLSTLSAQLPVVLQALILGFSQILTLLGELLPTLIPIIISAVVGLAETLISNIDLIIDAGISLIMGLASGLIAAAPDLIAKIPVLIEKLVSAITSNLPKLLKMGIDLTLKLAAGLIQAAPQLASKIPEIVKTILSGLGEAASSVFDIGKDIVRGLWNGISDMASWIGKKIKGFGEDVLGGIKDFFGIKSPSRVMADVIGKNLALGIGMGFEDEIDDVNDKITGSVGAITSGGVSPYINSANAPVGKNVTINQTNNYSQAHNRYELWQSRKDVAAAVRLAMT